MTTAQLASFDRCNAAHEAFVATYQTDKRPAAIVESDAADAQFIACMVGAEVWVKADYEQAGLVLGQVSMAFERGDVRTEHGVICWGEFCPASYSLDRAHEFFAAAQARLEYACSRD